MLTIFFYEEQRCEMIETWIERPEIGNMETLRKIFRLYDAPTNTKLSKNKPLLRMQEIEKPCTKIKINTKK